MTSEMAGPRTIHNNSALVCFRLAVYLSNPYHKILTTDQEIALKKSSFHHEQVSFIFFTLVRVFILSCLRQKLRVDLAIRYIYIT